jgi:hypothetical protein
VAVIMSCWPGIPVVNRQVPDPPGRAGLGGGGEGERRVVRWRVRSGPGGGARSAPCAGAGARGGSAALTGAGVAGAGGGPGAAVADPLAGGQHLGRGQFPAGQPGVPRRLRPPLHPGHPGRMLPPPPRLARVHFHHRAGDRGAQPGRGQRPGPAQDQVLRRLGLGGVQQGGGRGDDPGLVPGQHPGPERRPGPRQADLQHRSHPQHLLRIPADTASAAPSSRQANSSHRAGTPDGWPGGAAGGGTAADQLRDRRMLTGTHIRLDPVQRADHPSSSSSDAPRYRS